MTAKKGCAKRACGNTPVMTTVKVLRAVCLELRIPATIKNPKRAAEQAVKGWPNRKAITSRGIEIVRVVEGVEAADSDCN